MVVTGNFGREIQEVTICMLVVFLRGRITQLRFLSGRIVF